MSDARAVLDSTRRLLHEAGFETHAYDSGGAFLQSREQRASHCVVLDVRLSDMSGLDLQEHLRASGDRIPVVFVTGNGEIEAAVRAMRLGAFDFLEKPVDASRLVDRVGAAVAEYAAMEARLAWINEARQRLRTLSRTERIILDELVRGRTNAEIAASLHRSRRTIENHRARILQKMGARNIADLVRMAILASMDEGGRLPGIG